MDVAGYGCQTANTISEIVGSGFDAWDDEMEDIPINQPNTNLTTLNYFFH